MAASASEPKARLIVNQIKAILISCILILIGQQIGFKIPIIKAIPGMLIVLLICIVAILVKDFTPRLKFPAFAWASCTVIDHAIRSNFKIYIGIYQFGKLSGHHHSYSGLCRYRCRHPGGSTEAAELEVGGCGLRGLFGNLFRFSRHN